MPMPNAIASLITTVSNTSKRIYPAFWNTAPTGTSSLPTTQAPMTLALLSKAIFLKSKSFNSNKTTVLRVATTVL